MDTYATINFQDGHIRLYAEARLEPEVYQRVKENGFIWKRNQGAFDAPYAPWRFNFLKQEFGIEELQEDETDLKALAEDKAERYEGYSENAGKRSEQAYKGVKAIADAIPFGQPILIGHHSEKRHRAAVDKIDRGMRKTVEEGKKRDYWEYRAKAALSRMKRKEAPGAIYRRIEKLEADKRRMEREYTGETRAAWVWFFDNRLAFERALYEASGGIAAAALAFEVGGGVCYRGWSWYEVKKVNKKTITIKGWLGSDNMTYKLSLDEVKGAMSKEEWATCEKVRAGTGWQVKQQEATNNGD